MNTTIYLLRHSEPMKRKSTNMINSDSLQIWNEKGILSINGEKRAEIISKNKELQNIDLVISSNYVRSLSTAKYIAEQNNKEITVIESFGERKFGINSWDELPSKFEQKQIEEPTFKMENGESQIEVANRMHESLLKVLKENKGKRIVIVSHATALTFLFIQLGEYKENKIYFKDNVVIDENFVWEAPEVFKLEYDNEELMSLENVKLI